ncbi:sulfatase-like hydrolase/transferase [Photorhabdus kayaii]|uniref:sulfatase-like hydrolase/transferase n=1 Tax=Photorhabdus kayaii TaxID=230088 RepID=UPI0021D4F41C|nr:sulfatase-like hydrolase/transferase [Photorhabdus kayaii]MCT8351855.1 sulfatase-like hydrolase/transferase [Photorhabdus kayaii]
MSYFDFYSLSSSISMLKEAFITYRDVITSSFILHIPLIISLFIFPNQKIGLKAAALGISTILISILLISGIIFYKKTGQGAEGMPPSAIIPAYYIDLYLDKNLDHNIYNRHLLLKHIPKDKFKNIILIIDESIRYDFIDINNNTGTTPYLFKIHKLLNLGKASSYANCSQYTNILIRKMSRYKHEVFDIKSNVYIWDVMNKAGYKNILIDAQLDGNGHNFFTSKELENGKVNVIKSSFKKDDIEIAKLANEIIKNKEKNFILIIKKGAHFPYLNDGIKKIFLPNMNSSNIKFESKENIINSYKNLVFHNTNLFFESLNKNKKDTIFIYTSDHGQDFEKLNEKMTHCTTTNPMKTEGEVPLFIFGQYKEDDFSPMIKQILHRGKNSHYDIPFFLMDFAGYSDDDIISLMGSPVSVDSFVYGNVYGFFGGAPERKSISQ